MISNTVKRNRISQLTDYTTLYVDLFKHVGTAVAKMILLTACSWAFLQSCECKHAQFQFILLENSNCLKCGTRSSNVWKAAMRQARYSAVFFLKLTECDVAIYRT